MPVELITTKVTGKILTVTLRYLPPIDGGDLLYSTGYPPEQVSYIEDATAKQYGILQDESGSYLASPLSTKTGNLNIDVISSPLIVWFKFPAPSPEAQTISINIPDVAPFDGVPVQR